MVVQWHGPRNFLFITRTKLHHWYFLETGWNQLHNVKSIYECTSVIIFFRKTHRLPYKVGARRRRHQYWTLTRYWTLQSVPNMKDSSPQEARGGTHVPSESGNVPGGYLLICTRLPSKQRLRGYQREGQKDNITPPLRKTLWVVDCIQLVARQIGDNRLMFGKFVMFSFTDALGSRMEGVNKIFFEPAALTSARLFVKISMADLPVL